MTAKKDQPTRLAPLRRWLLWGWIIGVVITVPATFFALLSPAGETLHPYLVPSAGLLAPLSGAMAEWPALVNLAIACIVNGLVYATVAGAVGAVRNHLRHR